MDVMKPRILCGLVGLLIAAWVIWNELAWLGKTELARVVIALAVGLGAVSVGLLFQDRRGE
jgi:predicted membrane-bound spermidine synthase